MRASVKILPVAAVFWSFDGFAQSILDSCYTSAAPSTTFSSSATLIDAYDADLVEWTGTTWTGAWSNANVVTPPPCNTPPVRAIWIGDDSVWTTGGEGFGLKLASPITAGTTYLFFFTYISEGFGSNGAFSPNVYTNNSGAATGNYVGDLIPAGYAWVTHPFSFTASAAQAGDEYLIIHSNSGSGMVLNLCAETLTDLGDDSLTICFGDSAVLFAGNGFQSYSWNTGDTTPQITVHTSGTYISVNQGFCGTSTDTIVVTVDPCGMFPVAVFTTPDNHICPGTCTDFTNLSQNATSYQWTFGGATPSASTDVNPVSICYNTPGTYPVQLIATNSLTSDTLTLNNFITVYPYPPPQGITQSGDTLFANPGAVSYQWYHNGSPVPGATDYFYVATEGGDYNIVATDGNGCEVEAAIFDVIAMSHFPSESGRFEIFPQPVSNRLHISCSLSDPGHASFQLYAMTGQKLLPVPASISSVQVSADVSTLAQGIYCFTITDGTEIICGRFTKD